MIYSKSIQTLQYVYVYFRKYSRVRSDLDLRREYFDAGEIRQSVENIFVFAPGFSVAQTSREPDRSLSTHQTFSNGPDFWKMYWIYETTF